MILSDISIKSLIHSGKIVIRNINQSIQTPNGASIDLSLGEEFMEVEKNISNVIDPRNKISYRKFCSNSVQIPPLSFLLATTQQYIELPDNITAFIDGRSSIGRMGLFVQNAGWVAPGFCGKLTLELFNAASVPILLYSGLRVCQIVFCDLDKSSSSPYKGKYQGQASVWGSLVHEDLS